MQRLEVSDAVRPIYGSLGVKRLKYLCSLLSLTLDTWQAFCLLDVFSVIIQSAPYTGC